jgi:outer membrane protein insertion porin family
MKGLLALALLLLACGASGCRGAPEARGEGPVAPTGGDTLVHEVGARRVEIRGLPPGNDELALSAISELLEQYDRSNGVDAYLDDAAFELELALRSAGHPTAEVDYDEGLVNGREGATLTVAAGPRVLIERVEVVGIDGISLPVSELRGILGEPKPTLFGGSGDWVYDLERIGRAPARIEAALATEGYVDAEVRVVEPDFAGVTVPIVLEVVVVPGRRHRLGGIALEFSGSAPRGDDEAPQAAEAQPGPPSAAETTATAPAESVAACQRVVEAVLGPADSRPRSYSPRIEKDLYGALVDALARRGHADAVVRIVQEPDAARARMHLIARIDAGPIVHVGAVRFEGAKRTRPRFLANRVELEAGDVHDAAALREDVRRLYRTGLFSEVRTRLAGEGETRDLVFELLERSGREVYVEPGYGSYELLRVKAGYRDRNLFGSGVSWRTEATAAIRALRASSTLTDPWLFDHDLIGDLRIEYDEREEPSFDRLQRGVGAFVTKEWTPRHSSSFGYQFRRSEVHDVTIVESGLEDDPDVVDLSTLRFTQRSDGRDDVFVPSTGVFAEGTLEYGSDALGSELNFVRSTLTLSNYRALGALTVLAASVRTGVIVPFAEDDSIPLQERFFNGGASSVRSFRESELGPRDINGEPIGGETFTTLGVELRRGFTASMQGALFVDAGNVAVDHSDYFDFADMRYGIGAGFRYVLPIGPLRFDFGVNPDPEPDEDDWAAHFSIGMAF